ncbi:MAG: MBL fold metallo-hydrolase [Blastocatellia bacterium]|nr:MBL fold metallo-hydrolase [Blastocatellia bacterium]
MKVVYNRGLYLPEIDLWMDAKAPRSRSVISHAHADHIQRHDSIIATPATARLFEHRIGKTRSLLLDFHETSDFTDFKLTFYPAGHCLGSAQTLIEYRGERVLYTGDFKLRAGLSCEPPEIIPCDILIMDTTFGRPHYLFPKDEEVRDELYREIDRAFMNAMQPVVFAYSLGKGQEALQILLRGGYSVALHESVMKIVDIYREMGIEFDGDYRRLDPSDTDGLVVMLPPGSRRGELMKTFRCPYTIYLSGWGMDPRARYRYQTHLVLPLSDHAGFDDLERYVIDSGAKRVYTLYGDDYFASHLRQMGIPAEHLHGEGGPFRKPSKGKGSEKSVAQPSLFDLIE